MKLGFDFLWCARHTLHGSARRVRRAHQKLPNLVYSPILLTLCLLLCSCTVSKQPDSTDFSRFHDQPLPLEVARWLEQGPQSQPDPTILQTGRQIQGKNRRERLYRAVDYFWEQFRYDTWRKDQMFQRTAAEMFADKALGGCSDYALVMATLFRETAIPARLVLTANGEWIRKFRNNLPAMTSGHVFIEVFLEDRWYLVDPPYRKLYTGYDPTNPNYPRKELFCLRGVDYWSLGIKSVKQLDKIFARITVDMNPEQYKKTQYVAHQL